MTAADWGPSERSWRLLQRRARALGLALVRTDPDDGEVHVLEVAGSASDPVLRLHRDQAAVTARVEAAEAACIRRSREAVERRP